MGLPSVRDASRRGHDEPWLVSYADMMTLLLGFFIILNSFADLDEKKLEEFGKQVADDLHGKYLEKPRAEPKVDDVQRQLDAFRTLLSLMNPAAGVVEQMERIERLAAKVDADKALGAVVREELAPDLARLDALVAPGTRAEESVVELELPSRTLFAPGSADLGVAAGQQVQRLGAKIARLKGVVRIEVVGHTDSAAAVSSRFGSNWALSSARAGAVAEVLLRAGVRRDALAVRGMADLEPLYPEADARGGKLADNMEKNRRVAIVVRRAAAPAAGRP